MGRGPSDSTITIGSNHYDTILLEKWLCCKVPVLQLLKTTSPTVFKLQGSYRYQKKRKEVFYTPFESFFQISNFEKNCDLEFQNNEKRVFKKKCHNLKTKMKSEKNSIRW